ncbi:molybdenum-pterin binding domain-containing protein [Arboricoccus pini]|uniref:Molybdenum-pterin binding domain-containing protein n=1 Tax=Arboricoccus pini TaxID=1963835 RepID=A0A212RNX2_9PROT|nr:TOBE domain-containing protein [Arboricoccus pini]SNB74237.1 molybdenum-pterin binding domain-containing protein [Arboricoccus pini]
MKLSARNTIKGKIVEIKEGSVMAIVVIEIGTGERLSSAITLDSVQEMGLKVGDQALAVIKSTEVMVALP